MKPQRILIADDDPKLLALLTSSLRKSGYETSEAPDGEAALEFVKHEKPDLIVADITMPKIDGFELCKRIRENPDTAAIPFIFLTAKGELSDRVAGLNLGADDYISKPFHISEVMARIKAILQRTASITNGSKDEGESALKGNLEQMSIAELIQTLNMNKKTGGLKIINQARVGKIFFDSGDILKASLGKYKSEEAVYRILSWDEGYFEFDANDKAGKADIKTGTTSLLMNAFNQKEEYLKYKEAMPPYDAVVNIKEGQSIDQSKPTLRKIAELIDGHRTIQNIINISSVNYLVTVKVLYTLLKKDVIEAIELVQPVEEEDYGQLAHDLYE